MSNSVQPHRGQPTRLPRPWNSPGKNTGVGCHFLLQCMKVKMKGKALSHVRLLATPWTAAYQAPPPMGFSRQEYWSGVPLPSPGLQCEPCLFCVNQLLCHEKVYATTILVKSVVSIKRVPEFFLWTLHWAAAGRARLAAGQTELSVSRLPSSPLFPGLPAGSLTREFSMLFPAT